MAKLINWKLRMRKTEKVQPRNEVLERENSGLSAALAGSYSLLRTQPKSLLPQLKGWEGKSSPIKNSQDRVFHHSHSDSCPGAPLTAGLTLPSAPLTPARPTQADSLIQTCLKARIELLTNLQPSAVTALALSTPTRYPVLELSSQGLKDGDLGAIARLLEVYPYAQALDLYGNELVFASVPRPEYSTHFSIRRLCVSNNLGMQVGQGLAALLRQFPLLESLEMNRCGLNDADVTRLCLILEERNRLAYLSLSGNPISDSSLPALHALLSALPQLTLVLKDTSIGHKGGHTYRLRTLPVHQCCLLC